LGGRYLHCSEGSNLPSRSLHGYDRSHIAISESKRPFCRVLLIIIMGIMMRLKASTRGALIYGVLPLCLAMSIYVVNAHTLEFLGMLFFFIGLIGVLGSEVFPGAEYFSRRGVLPHPAEAIHYPRDSDLRQVWILVLVGVIVFLIGFLSP
jgi:hypothetical protein